MALTLRDVARMAGVSPTTVSRVLNGRGEVRDEVRRQVQDVIRSSGYRPLASARSLASQRLGVIGLAIPMQVATIFNDPYFGRLLAGVSRSATALDLTLALFVSDSRAEENALVERVIGPRLVDGLIVSVLEADDDSLEPVREAGFPIVTLNTERYLDAFCSVAIDDEAGARRAVEFLLGNGAQRVAHVAGPPETLWGRNRLRGYRTAVAEAGASLRPLVATGGFEVEDGARAMESLLAERPDAVFVATDKMAAGVLQVLERAALRVPEDVAVIGFDGVASTGPDGWRLSTVRQPVEEVADAAVRLLMEQVNGRSEIRTVTLPVDLVLGESTTPA